MTTAIDPSGVCTNLRDRAEQRLTTGTPPSAGAWTMGVDALRLLHRLSSNPDQAEDALQLLHELQVHQVELDLQREEIAASEHDLAEDLREWRLLYQHAPVACFLVDRDGTVLQGNLAGAELLGIGQGHLPGQRIDQFPDPAGAPLVLGLLHRVAQSGLRDSCIVEREQTAGAPRLQFLASVPPGREQILLACCEWPDPR